MCSCCPLPLGVPFLGELQAVLGVPSVSCDQVLLRQEEELCHTRASSAPSSQAAGRASPLFLARSPHAGCRQWDTAVPLSSVAGLTACWASVQVRPFPVARGVLLSEKAPFHGGGSGRTDSRF